MITVTGATGLLGRLVIDALLKERPASEIVAAVRSPDKARDLEALGVQVRQADYNNTVTLKKAFDGTDKLLLISSSEVGQRARQHRAVIAAAHDSDVGLVAYTSMLHADTSPLALAAEHVETEAALRDSGLLFVLLRHGWYMENHTAGIPAVLEHGTLLGCVGDGRVSAAARADFAAADAAALLLEGQAGLVYELAGDESYTMTELADEITKQSGKKVVYNDMPEAEYRKMLMEAGLPGGLAVLLANSDTGASKGGLFDESRQLSRLIGRPTTTLKEGVAAALKG